MIIITGGSGFIGSHLASKLIDDGNKVRVIDIVPPPLGVGAEFVRGSVLDPLRLSKLFEGAEAIAHLAALVDVSASVKDPYSDFSVNALGTLFVLEAARKAGVKNVVFASSAAVYGNPTRLPISESHPTSPLSPYGNSKLAAEKQVLLCNSLYGIGNTALRLFNVYGSGQSPQSPYSGVITKFASAIKGRKRPIIYGDGGQTRDFVHVDDVCDAFCFALFSRGHEMPMNIASGREISVKDLLWKMCALADVEPHPEYLPAREGEIEKSVADTALARKEIGFSPKIPLSQGLAELVA